MAPRSHSLAYVRETYGVPAVRGLRVTVDGRPGRITSGTHYIFVRFDGARGPRACHPTWRVTYHMPNGDWAYDDDGKLTRTPTAPARTGEED